MISDVQGHGAAGVRPVIDFRSAFRAPLPRALAGGVQRLLKADEVNRIYSEIVQRGDGQEFMQRCIEVMRLSVQAAPEDIARIPATGPVVVVANHPFGGVEGVVLAHLLGRARPDFKLMANYLLSRVEAFRKWLILVDPFGGEDSARVNMRPVKESLSWLGDGHLLGVFPAGEVSHLHLNGSGVVDPKWSPMIARLIRRTGATVVPVYFEGANGPLFQLAGMVHPRLRTALLAKEFANKCDSTIRVQIGHPIPPTELSGFTDDESLTNYIRLRTYNLRHRRKRSPVITVPKNILPRRAVPESEPVADARPAEIVARDLASLPAEQKLLTSGKLSAWYARAPQIPNLLHEIGRQRELTFREAGEGSGRALDLDRFDQAYLHLIVWDDEKGCLAGACRLGATDEILPVSGIRGLYTSTLFRYRRALLNRISPALEMGRSFICPAYQRHYASLFMLWKGIGRFVVLFPRYRNLFGPVSINAAYSSSSQALLVRFLRDNNSVPRVAHLVKARRPLRMNPFGRIAHRQVSQVVKDIDGVDALISDVDTHIGGVPVLLRQYLKLGGKLLGFNLDPDFSNVLDGLILVDLAQTDPVILARYLTKEGVASFRAHHGVG